MRTIRIALFFFFSLLLVGNKLMAQNPNNGDPISLTTEIVDHGGQVPSSPKTPVTPPEVSINGHYLYFTGTHAEFVLTLTDEEDNVVFTTVVYDTDTQVVLPSSLSGTFELRLYTDIYCFVGEIIL